MKGYTWNHKRVYRIYRELELNLRIFGLDRLSEQLEFPFGRHTNDLPLDAICKVHEITVVEALGEPAPEPLQPVEYQLQ